MNNRKHFIMAWVILMGVSGAAAQSLGDYARTVRKNKPGTVAASRHFDNDNLPTNQTLSVVGPAPAPAPEANAAGQGSVANAAPATAADPAPKTADRQKAAEELQKKFDKQKEKLDALNHELDLDQREYRLRTAAIYGDVGNRLRNSVEWDKEDAQYKTDIDAKQKAIESARQQLDEMQEEARKAGVAEKDNDKAKN